MHQGRPRQSLLTYFTIPLLAGALFFSATANAAFITDKIVVEVRTERFGQGSVLKKLPSGSAVDVLMTDGQYTRIRTADNVTGWVNSSFITKEKPNQLEYLELLAKSKATEAKLRTAEEKLAARPGTDSDSTNSEEIEILKKQAQDARWMKVEMMKARDRAEQAEAKLKASGKQSGDNKQALEKLRTQNKELEQRLAAALLVNEQQEISLQESANAETVAEASMPLPTLNTESAAQDDGWSVNMKWFFGSLFTALLIGFVTGITWLDKRSRQRHGGFRIY
jgi:SH3 domain protein